ncbi:MAG: hypothetical protein L6Q97_07835 [Thermoanaerobaculia bacterium]|nr:hypothetical protein [Thermoanaerobaculia bacterium]
MRKLLFCLALLPSFLYAQPDSLYGVVSVLNSRFDKGRTEFVANAGIHCSAQLAGIRVRTGPDGRFVIGRRGQEPFLLVLDLPDYEVANLRDMQIGPGMRDTVHLYVIPGSSLFETTQRYYAIVYAAMEKRWLKQAAPNAVHGEEQRQAAAEKCHLVATILSRKFSSLNLDDTSPAFQDAFRRFQAGDPDLALLWLRYTKIDSLNPRQQAQLLDFKADLHQIRQEPDSAEQCYRQQLLLNEQNVFARWHLATFLNHQGRNGESVEHLEKCLPLLRSGIDSVALLLQLGNTWKTLSGYLPEAEHSFLQAVSICERLAACDSAQFTPILAEVYGSAGAFFGDTEALPQAANMFEHAQSIYKRLRQHDLPGYGPLEANMTLAFAMLLVQHAQLENAARMSSSALALQTEVLLTLQASPGQEYWLSSQFNARLRDSLEARRQYQAVVELQHLRVRCIDTLRALDNRLVQQAALEYGNLSWQLLFTGQYPEAEHAARKALELDNTQLWVKTNLGHSFMLRGDLKKAKQVYGTYIEGDGSKAKTMLLKDFIALEAAGVRHKNIAKAREWVEKQ